jgi:hypothetical protein
VFVFYYLLLARRMTVTEMQQVDTFIRLSQRKLIIDKIADKCLRNAVLSRNALIQSARLKRAWLLRSLTVPDVIATSPLPNEEEEEEEEQVLVQEEQTTTTTTTMNDEDDHKDDEDDEQVPQQEQTQVSPTASAAIATSAPLHHQQQPQQQQQQQQPQQQPQQHTSPFSRDGFLKRTCSVALADDDDDCLSESTGHEDEGGVVQNNKENQTTSPISRKRSRITASPSLDISVICFC